MSKSLLDEPLIRLAEGRHHNPFEVLGRHPKGKNVSVRCYLPGVQSVRIVENQAALERIPGSDYFYYQGNPDTFPDHYQLTITDSMGGVRTLHDPYSFGPILSDFDLHLFSEGKHWHAYRILGAHQREVEGVPGILFAVWAPNAQRVSVIGDFNQWDGRIHPMRNRGASGVWELFIPDLKPGGFYRYELRSAHGEILTKNDPYAEQFQIRPENAGLIPEIVHYQWGDSDWTEGRNKSDWQHRPISIYEVHLGSWQRGENGAFLNYREIAHRLRDHVVKLGFTHIELLPITEHPFDGSWGYQATGYFAPTSRFGTPDDFRYFIDTLHQADIGVILDWVPAHFPKDQHALARFDGTALYEHEDPRLGEHKDWGTLIFNYGRAEVRNFLLSSAIYWLEEFHLDGLRVDAVASMLYLDYSRNPGEWIPNKYGGRENLEAVDFLRHLNAVTHDQFPGTLMIAEESTAWPQVSRPTWLGGLGFSMKWNMGWMHDTLAYFSKDPVHRHFHHDQLTFGLLYAFTENFVLPFSHDEVVHGKGSLLDKMPGDGWQKFASLRLLYSYMLTYPGKKLLFMGCEFAQGREWNEGEALDWYLLERSQHQGIQALLGQLNQLYRELPALHTIDFEPEGFEWIDCHDANQSVLSYLRRSTDGQVVIVVLNFTPVPRENYRIGVPQAGKYLERLNSDSAYFGGSNMGNSGIIEAEENPWMNHPFSVEVTLPPLGALILVPA